MNLDLIFGKISSDRLEKGKNIIDFPTDFTVVDLEATGFSTAYDSILEVSALKVRNGDIIDTFSSLTLDGDYVYIEDYITELTGITQEMINSAPKTADIFPKFIEFISDDIVIGHNVNFDINFIYDTSMSILRIPFKNNFVDTMRLSRRLYPDWEHHRLADLANFYNVSSEKYHRALADCYTTLSCYNKIKLDIESKYSTTDSFIDIFKNRKSLHASDITTTKTTFDQSHPIFNKVCVFTGKLDKMTRKEAMQIVADFGGINGDGVTKKTNFLILGNTDYCSNIKNGKSSKYKKAESLKLSGQDIEIIPENAFYDMISTD